MSGNPIRDWVADRTTQGVVQPTAGTLGAKSSPAVTGRHWLPTTGALAEVNQSLGDPALDLWVTCEVRLDAVGPRWKARFNVYLHKRKDADVPADHPLVQRVGQALGRGIDTAGWKEWRTAVTETRQDLSVEEAYAFADQQVAAYGGRPAAAAAAPASTPAPTPAPAPAPTNEPAPATVERQVFVASRIAGYPKARAVRHSIKTKLRSFGYQAYIAEGDSLDGYLQTSIDRMVETSDHMVAIVWDTVGEATFEEIALATRAAARGGRPRVHLFVSLDQQHAATRTAEPSRRTQDFLDRLNQEGRYVRYFQGDRDLVDQVADLFAGLDL